MAERLRVELFDEDGLAWAAEMDMGATGSVTWRSRAGGTMATRVTTVRILRLAEGRAESDGRRVEGASKEV